MISSRKIKKKFKKYHVYHPGMTYKDWIDQSIDKAMEKEDYGLAIKLVNVLEKQKE